MIARCGRYVLALHIVLFPVFLIALPRGLAAVTAVTGALCLLDYRVRRELRGWVDSPVARILVLLIAWIGLSALWAVDSGMALLTFGKLAGQLLFGFALLTAALRLPQEDLRLAQRTMAIAALLLLVALYAVALTDGQVARPFRESDNYRDMFYRQAAVFAVLLFPLALMVHREFRRAWFAVAYFMASALCVFLLLMNAAKLALMAALILALAPLALGRRGATLVGAALAIAVIAAPFLPYRAMLPADVAVESQALSLPISWVHRLFIWEYTAGRIEEAFVFGFGAQSARFLSDTKVLIAESRVDLMPLHPHNAALQVWLELGIVGAILFASLLLAAARSVRQCALRIEMGLGIGALVAFCVVSFLSYGAWQNWWLACAWTAAAMCMLAMRRAPPKDRAGL